MTERIAEIRSKVMRISIIALMAAGMGAVAHPVSADGPTDPGTYGTAAPNAQCDTAASSGAFNARNEVYGPNSREFGLAGGSGGGQTGMNNSAVCGNRK